jgi:hypothetical protein
MKIHPRRGSATLIDPTDSPPDSRSRRAFINRSGQLAMAIPAALAFGPRLAPALEASRDPWLAGAQTRALLALMARRLFPHDALPEALYQRVAGVILERAAGSPRVTDTVRDGTIALDAHGEGRPWMKLPEAAQVTALKTIEQHPLFALVRDAAIEVLYRDPRTWRLLGYSGSAIEHGGYLHRGFDDIDWLPAD